MRSRTKKLFGAVILPTAIFAYVLVAGAAADFIPDHWAARLAYFAVAGLAWIWPAKLLIQWMNSERDPPRRERS